MTKGLRDSYHNKWGLGVNYKVPNASNAGTANTAGALSPGNTISITGDLTYTSSIFTGRSPVTSVGTLATVNSTVGTFGSTTAVPVVTVNAKGLVTTVTTAALGTAAVANTGTSGHTLPFLDGTGITYTNAVAFTSGVNFGDVSFFADIQSSNPVIAVDTNDYYVYSRASNQHEWFINSSVALLLAANGVVLYASGSPVSTAGTTQIVNSVPTKDLVTVFASLPSAITQGAGARAFITDATLATFASAAVGGGTINIGVYSDGAAWRIG